VDFASFWDIEVKGLGIQVSPAGYKSYIFQSTRENTKVQAAIGSAESWSGDDARDKARELRKLHESGSDARAALEEPARNRE
jgi:hypothetical protein